MTVFIIKIGRYYLPYGFLVSQTNLLSAMGPCYQRLTEEELQRNTHGPMLIYTWSPASLGLCLLPKLLPTFGILSSTPTRGSDYFNIVYIFDH